MDIFIIADVRFFLFNAAKKMLKAMKSQIIAFMNINRIMKIKFVAWRKKLKLGVR